MLLVSLFILFEPYALTISLFERALALHNFIAFLSFYTQWRGLIGSRGISSAREIMQRVQQRGWTWQTRWRDLPTLFWVSCSDVAIQRVQLLGMVASVCAFLGIFSGWSVLVAAVCYSSIKSVGGVFTGLQMHAHLMEIDILYSLSAPFLHVSPAAFVVLASTLNFRVMFGGGTGKFFGGDKSWLNGTAMTFHYWTQPLPNPMSALMHRMPLWWHKMETNLTFIHETLCACFVFAPVWLRVFAFLGFESLMLIINTTGNYAQIGAHTINESLLLLNDDVYHYIFDKFSFIPGANLIRQFLLYAHGPSFTDMALRAAPAGQAMAWNDVALGALPWLLLVLPYALVQLIPLTSTFHGHNLLEMLGPVYSERPLRWYEQWMESDTFKKRVQPVWAQVWAVMQSVFVVGRDFDLFGSYVKFTHMTKFRHEIIIEGSNDDGVTWKEYDFKCKPSRVTKRPPFVPFHLPAMDWRLWFLPLEAARGGDPPSWFVRILARLLECEPTVMDLFAFCPFDASNRPTLIRAVLYDYRFRAGYEQEEELKHIVEQHGIKDTNIVTQSEEEDDDDEEEEEEQSDHELFTLSPDDQSEHDEAEVAAATDAKEQHAQLRTHKKIGEGDSSMVQPEEEMMRGGPRTDEKAEAAAASGVLAPAADNSQQVRSRARKTISAAEREAKQKALMMRQQRKLIRSLLRASGRVAKSSKPEKRLVARGTVPAEFDEHGQRVYWVRRHLIGPYGPTLAARPAPPPQQQQQTAQTQEAWEQALDEQ